MKIEENDGKILCDCGCCKNASKYAIKFYGLGSKSNINICESCLCDIYSESKRILRGNKHARK